MSKKVASQEMNTNISEGKDNNVAIKEEGSSFINRSFKVFYFILFYFNIIL